VTFLITVGEIMAFERFPLGEEEEDEECEETVAPYFPVESIDEGMVTQACRYCGSYMFKGVVVLYVGQNFLFVSGTKCVDCCHAIYSPKDVMNAKKILEQMMLRDGVGRL
jgi:ribosomal protein L24E